MNDEVTDINEAIKVINNLQVSAMAIIIPAASQTTKTLRFISITPARILFIDALLRCCFLSEKLF